MVGPHEAGEHGGQGGIRSGDDDAEPLGQVRCLRGRAGGAQMGDVGPGGDLVEGGGGILGQDLGGDLVEEAQCAAGGDVVKRVGLHTGRGGRGGVPAAQVKHSHEV